MTLPVVLLTVWSQYFANPDSDSLPLLSWDTLIEILQTCHSSLHSVSVSKGDGAVYAVIGETEQGTKRIYGGSGLADDDLLTASDVAEAR
eukprot:6733105-Alexandrium_andersonii.AAC.1